jgi:hypothetical protein
MIEFGYGTTRCNDGFLLSWTATVLVLFAASGRVMS